MDVGIIGHGFVGLACETGFQTFSGVRIYDKYKPSESLDSVVDNCNIIFLCVPTPLSENDECDTSILFEVIKKINEIANDSKILVIKSTVIPGTTELCAQQFPRHTFIFNPEFLTEANFIIDFLKQDRIILGMPPIFKNEDLEEVMNFYGEFVSTQPTPAELIITSSKIAEMVKYTSNCFLATKLSFFNEIYEICQEAHIDYEQMVTILTKDSRIGSSHCTVPGSDGLKGWGKSCLPKDLNALMSYAKNIGVDPLMLESTWLKNLMVREEFDWENLAQVNGDYDNADSSD